jgi:hypothetical protein
MLTSGQRRDSAVIGVIQRSTRQTAGQRDLTAGQRHRSAAKATGHGSETSGQLPEEAIGGQRRRSKGPPARRRCAASRQSRQREHWRPVRCQGDCLRGGGEAAEGGGLERGRLEDVVGVVRVRLRARTHRFLWSKEPVVKRASGQDRLLTSGQRDQCDQWSKEPVVKTTGADSKTSVASASAFASVLTSGQGSIGQRGQWSKEPVVKGASGQRSWWQTFGRASRAERSESR